MMTKRRTQGPQGDAQSAKSMQDGAFKAIGFGDVESDLACSQRIEDRLCEVGEAQYRRLYADAGLRWTTTP